MDNYNLHKELEQYRGVVGVGDGYKVVGGSVTNIPAKIVYVEEKLPLSELSMDHVVPESLDGVQTDVIAIGKPVAYEYTKKYRPAPGGISIGHKDITAGTLGSKVFDSLTGDPLILSNNHVLANSNAGATGDPIYQPGPADGGTQTDTIAKLLRFVPIVFDEVLNPPTCNNAQLYAKVGNLIAKLLNSNHRVQAYSVVQAEPNYVDCAVAKPLVSADVASNILDVGTVKGVASAVAGMSVKKTGRTTEHTKGTVQAINVSIKVGYGGSSIATFADQIMVAGEFSAPGDSGSLVLDNDNYAVGLLFAGGNNTTIVNPIHYVTEKLNIKFN